MQAFLHTTSYKKNAKVLILIIYWQTERLVQSQISVLVSESSPVPSSPCSLDPFLFLMKCDCPDYHLIADDLWLWSRRNRWTQCWTSHATWVTWCLLAPSLAFSAPPRLTRSLALGRDCRSLAPSSVTVSCTGSTRWLVDAFTTFCVTPCGLTGSRTSCKGNSAKFMWVVCLRMFWWMSHLCYCILLKGAYCMYVCYSWIKVLFEFFLCLLFLHPRCLSFNANCSTLKLSTS